MVSISRSSNQIVDNKWIRKPAEYRNVETGAVAILGNGASLNDYPVDRLSIPAIGVNRSYKKLKTKYHCFVTPVMFNDVISGRLAGTDVVFCPWECFVLNRPGTTHDPGHSHWDNVQIRYVPVCTVGRHTKYHFDLENSVEANFGGLLAIMVAMWLGYSTIYLLGFDGDGTHFYDEAKHANDYSPQVAAFERLRDWLADHSEYNVYQTNPASLIHFFTVNTSVPLWGVPKNIYK